MHAVFDSQTLATHKKKTAVEKHREDVKQWVMQQVAHAVYLEDTDLSPANSDRQLGRPMFANELEVRLKKLSSNFLAETNPFNASKKALYYAYPGKGKVFVCAYENGVMPEHSIMKVKEEEVWDVEQTHIDRKDLPKHEYQRGVGFRFDPTAPRPGFKKVKLPWGEQKRGWRTVLLKIVIGGLATITDVERIFGTDDRAEWAGHTGKKPVTTPW